MPAVNVDDYYSAGYFLIRESKRPAWLDEPAGLVPDELISLESEFCPKLNISWGWNPPDRTSALDFGLYESKWDEFRHWCAAVHHKEIDIWSMLYSTDAARRFIQQFISESKWEKLFLVGVGLHRACEEDWQEPDGTEGVEIRILQHLPLEKGGHPLGFDVSSYAHHNFDHTWFSHEHYRGVFRDLGIRPGRYGLLQSQEEAILAQNYAEAHDKFSYQYWLLVSYPLVLGTWDTSSQTT